MFSVAKEPYSKASEPRDKNQHLFKKKKKKILLKTGVAEKCDMKIKVLKIISENVVFHLFFVGFFFFRNKN